jgi:hypothetical protein
MCGGNEIYYDIRGVKDEVAQEISVISSSLPGKS